MYWLVIRPRTKTLAEELCEENRRMALRMNAPKVGKKYTMEEARALCERADEIMG